MCYQLLMNSTNHIIIHIWFIRFLYKVQRRRNSQVAPTNESSIFPIHKNHLNKMTLNSRTSHSPRQQSITTPEKYNFLHLHNLTTAHPHNNESTNRQHCNNAGEIARREQFFCPPNLIDAVFRDVHYRENWFFDLHSIRHYIINERRVIVRNSPE